MNIYVDENEEKYLREFKIISEIIHETLDETILTEHSKGTEFKWKMFTYAVYFVRFMLFFIV